MKTKTVQYFDCNSPDSIHGRAEASAAVEWLQNKSTELGLCQAMWTWKVEPLLGAPIYSNVANSAMFIFLVADFLSANLPFLFGEIDQVLAHFHQSVCKWLLLESLDY